MRPYFEMDKGLKLICPIFRKSQFLLDLEFCIYCMYEVVFRYSWIVNTLSGGERQRISIARAFLKDAPIILLDEATASLDPENETLIQKVLGELLIGKTVIIIAHRLRTVENCDNIIVLDGGKIIEQGTHTELMENKKLYHKLFSLQKESLNWTV